MLRCTFVTTMLDARVDLRDAQIAVRHAREVVNGTPLLITENGIATNDDERRVAYVSAALGHLHEAMEDGVDVRGYLHWSALDNYEWGHWSRPFGLIEVDRTTFERRPKPSLSWLGGVARANALPTDERQATSA